MGSPPTRRRGRHPIRRQSRAGYSQAAGREAAGDAEMRERGGNRVTVKGRTYYYHRATGERLPDDLEARRKRLLEISRGAKIVKSKRGIGTIVDLIFKFRSRPEYAKLQPNTRRAYGRFLAALEADFGDD